MKKIFMFFLAMVTFFMLSGLAIAGPNDNAIFKCTSQCTRSGTTYLECNMMCAQKLGNKNECLRACQKAGNDYNTCMGQVCVANPD